jgi:drug/metabolite transporter (DMT)-like permease
MTSSPAAVRIGRRHPAGGGLVLALSSAAAFGLAGSLARSLLEIGWTPAGVVTARIGGAFLVLLIPCLLVLRRTGLPTRRQGGRLVAYGVLAIAMAQLCFFSAVQYLSVGVALLLEYSAPVLLIGWHWVRNGRRPRGAVLAGAGSAVVGLALVLDLTGGARVNAIGLAWGMGAAVGLCGYFLLSDESGTGHSVHPLVLTTAGTGVGAAVVATSGAVGFFPMAASTGTTVLAGGSLGWWVPMGLLIGLSGVLAYLTGILAVRRLGSSVASFVGLSEVIFAVLFAAILLGQRPAGLQLVGGLLVLVGIAVVQRRADEGNGALAATLPQPSGVPTA